MMAPRGGEDLDDNPIRLFLGLALGAMTIVGSVAALASATTWEAWGRYARGANVVSIAAAPVALAVCVAVVVLLWRFPPLRWSWWSVFPQHRDGGGPGNPIGFARFAPTVVAVALFAAIALGMPRFAFEEEVAFRFGTTGILDAIVRSAEFGAAHMVIGVPFAAAVGIGAAGLVFSAVYAAYGLGACATTHATYNLLIVTIAVVGLVRSSQKSCAA